jgi:hypothetical protein
MGLTPTIDYFENVINSDPNLNQIFFKNITFDGSLHTDFVSDVSGNLLKINASISTILPFKFDGSIFIFDTEVGVDANAGVWVKWDVNGILQEIGLKLHFGINSKSVFPILTLTSPNDISMYQGDTGVSVSWLPIYDLGIPSQAIISVDGLQVSTSSFVNNTLITADISSMVLNVGQHIVKLEISVRRNNTLYNTSDSVIVNVIKKQNVSTGDNIIKLNGTGINSNTTLNIKLSNPTYVYIEVSSNITGDEDAALKNSGLIGTNFYLNITLDDPSALQDIWINVSYADWNLSNLGITDENDLRIYFFNTSSSAWEPAGSTGVDTFNQVIYAHLDHLTSFAAVAKSKITTTPTITPTTTPTNTPTIPSSFNPISTDISSTVSISSKSTRTITPVSGFEILFTLVLLFTLGIRVGRKSF